jgi:phosphoribosylamine--glycine ligase
MVSSMDHKRAFDNDEGLNTGGMGTIAPNPYYTPDVAERCMNEIFLPTINAMAQEGRPFTGCLYFGLMLTADGPKVIEYNCRFGDPETQVVLPLLESSLLEIMMATADGTLGDLEVKFSDKAACCVVVASNGYPGKYETGFEITAEEGMTSDVIYAGAKEKDGAIVTGGGRVLCVVAKGENLPEAVANAYADVTKVHFENAYYRKDIGKKALSVLQERGN